MSNITETIDVEVPVRTAYNQWTQFEDFPQFMDGVEKITQIDDVTTHWVVNVGGRRKEFDARISEQQPDQRVSWTTEQGTEHAGVVSFHRLGDGLTRVTLQMDYEPEGAVEKAGDALGVVKRRVKGDLERFKKLIEARGGASGEWRGQIDQDPAR